MRSFRRLFVTQDNVVKLLEALFILASEILIQSLTIFRPLILTFFLNTILISLRLLVLVEIVAKCSW